MNFGAIGVFTTTVPSDGSSTGLEEEKRMRFTISNTKFYDNAILGEKETNPGLIYVDSFLHDVVIINCSFYNNSFNDPKVKVCSIWTQLLGAFNPYIQMYFFSTEPNFYSIIIFFSFLPVLHYDSPHS